MIFAHFSLWSSTVLCYKIPSFYQKTQQSLPMKRSTCGLVLMRTPFQWFNYLSLSLTKDKPISKFKLHHMCYAALTTYRLHEKIGCFYNNNPSSLKRVQNLIHYSNIYLFLRFNYRLTTRK